MKTVLVGLLSVCLVLAGCATTRHVRVPASRGEAPRGILVGDSVVAQLKTGESRRLHVTMIDSETVTGTDLAAAGAETQVQLALVDVAYFEVRKVSVMRTGGLVVGVVGALFVALLGAYLITCGSDSSKCSD